MSSLPASFSCFDDNDDNPTVKYRALIHMLNGSPLIRFRSGPANPDDNFNLLQDEAFRGCVALEVAEVHRILEPWAKPDSDTKETARLVNLLKHAMQKRCPTKCLLEAYFDILEWSVVCAEEPPDHYTEIVDHLLWNRIFKPLTSDGAEERHRERDHGGSTGKALSSYDTPSQHSQGPSTYQGGCYQDFSPDGTSHQSRKSTRATRTAARTVRAKVPASASHVYAGILKRRMEGRTGRKRGESYRKRRWQRYTEAAVSVGHYLLKSNLSYTTNMSDPVDEDVHPTINASSSFLSREQTAFE
ncbi:hypothetical protein QFC22_005977 [Naganishia vaughanmartiniae]|uniref:Uncharacterized protein n=1 Tax=Naganishia vaughanmartiniae TaxID=1424756 RepID=A0ACC2WQB4_9TREE|nr:hypothetical protein QFC22_005977 [Naganishia vaughanmartiniae]